MGMMPASHRAGASSSGKVPAMNFDCSSPSLMPPVGHSSLSQIFVPLQSKLCFGPGRERGWRRKSLSSWGAALPGAETALGVLLPGGHVRLRAHEKAWEASLSGESCGSSL